MTEGIDPVTLVEETEQRLGQDLSPERVEAIHDAYLNDEMLRLIGYADAVYFVIGNYDDETKPRLLEVRDVLDRRSPDHTAFLLEDVDPEVTAWRNFYVKFKVFAARADFIVGVFEDNDGGHELEIGEIPREKTWAFKREYESREEERANYDAMIAHLFDVLENEGRLVRWEQADELPELVDEYVP